VSRLAADTVLLLVAAIWGVAFYFQKDAMSALGPMTFVAARASVATLALLPLAVAERRRIGSPPSWPELRIVLAGGGAFLIAALFQQYGIVTATVTNSGFLTTLYVVFTPLMTWVLLGRRPSSMVWPAAAMCFMGTWLLGGATFGAFSTGDLLVAVCAVFWAMHVVITAGAARFDAPIGFTAMQFAVVAVLAGIGAMLLEPIEVGRLLQAWKAIAFVGLLSSALTFTLFTIAVRYTPAPEAAVIIGTESLFAAMAGALLLGERLSAISWLGAAVIIAGVLLLQLAPRR
jgi:drug/metabolite transporter (DMT)-like permease